MRRLSHKSGSVPSNTDGNTDISSSIWTVNRILSDPCQSVLFSFLYAFSNALLHVLYYAWAHGSSVTSFASTHSPTSSGFIMWLAYLAHSLLWFFSLGAVFLAGWGVLNMLGRVVVVTCISSSTWGRILTVTALVVQTVFAYVLLADCELYLKWEQHVYSSRKSLFFNLTEEPSETVKLKALAFGLLLQPFLLWMCSRLSPWCAQRLNSVSAFFHSDRHTAATAVTKGVAVLALLVGLMAVVVTASTLVLVSLDTPRSLRDTLPIYERLLRGPRVHLQQRSDYRPFSVGSSVPPGLETRPDLDPRPVSDLLPQPLIPPQARENIFFYLGESMRGDLISAQTTPNMYELYGREECITSEHHYSGGHVSEQGAFTAVWGLNAYHQRVFDDGLPMTLHALRLNGYDIAVFDSNGSWKDLCIPPRLVDHLDTMCRKWDKVARDRCASKKIAAYMRDREFNKTAHRPVAVLWYSWSCHHDYFYEPRFALHLPVLQRPVKKTPQAHQGNRQSIFNMFLNAMHQSDHYFGEVMQTMHRHSTSAKKQLIVAVVADHAEEFWEKGSWGHGSDRLHNERIVTPFALCLPPTRGPRSTVGVVPVYPHSPVPLSSHVDVMPTILHHLTRDFDEKWRPFFDGTSLLQLDIQRGQRLLTFQGNGFPADSDLFCIVDGYRSLKVWLRLAVKDCSSSREDGERVFWWDITKVTDLDDELRALEEGTASLEELGPSVYDAMWRFLKPVDPCDKH
eukprot:TRINITY_DN6040_c0_g1_i1.p1 TRINITY_DN6040_c0_g1~~TRINITY_DN6040_c0_g1_i1.p1  ORF type:complete len:737 (-),score=106.81 TRINITY_DN6040_c0_g1_i1:17-2227(-)